MGRQKQPCFFLFADKLKFSSFFPNLQPHLTTLYHRRVETAVMAHWKVVANGNIVVLQVFVEHVIHVGKTVFRTLILGEMSHDDALQLLEDAANFKLMKHAVDLRHRFARVFDEKNQSLVHPYSESRIPNLSIRKARRDFRPPAFLLPRLAD